MKSDIQVYSELLTSYGFNQLRKNITIPTIIKKAVQDAETFYKAYAIKIYFHQKGVTAVILNRYSSSGSNDFVVFPATSSNKKWGVANKEIDSETRLDALLGGISHPVYGKLKEPMSPYISYDDVQEQSGNMKKKWVTILNKLKLTEGRETASNNYKRILISNKFKEFIDNNYLPTNIKKAVEDVAAFYYDKYGSLHGYFTYFHPKGVTAMVMQLPNPADDHHLGYFPKETDLTYVVFPSTSSNKKWNVANKEIDNESALTALISRINHPVYGKLTDPISKYISYDDVEEQVIQKLQECLYILKKMV